MQLLWEFWRNRSQNRRRLQLFGNWLMSSSLTQHYPYSCLFRRCRGIVIDGIFELMWINVHFECIWVLLMMRCFRKLRKCYWCKIWLYCVLYMDAVLLMQNLRFLNLKWINFDLTCLTSPLPILTSCEDIGG